MDLSPEDVAEILRLLDDAPYDELAIEGARMTVVFRRGADGGWTQETRSLGSPPLLRLEGVAAPGRGPAPASGGAGPGEAGIVEICPPLAGTFYRAPKPGADPFVEVGSRVAAGTVVAIVETMKLMNSIHADAAGEIAEICVANGEFVEPTTVLMRVKAARP